MKIGIFTEVFPPSIGGQETRFAEMASELVYRGHSVTVFCVNNIAGCAEEESIAGVRIHRWPVAADYQNPLIKWLRRRPGIAFRYSLWCRRQAQEGFDVCIYNQWPLLHVVLATSDVRRRAILDWCEVRNGRVFNVIQKWLPRFAAKNIAVSFAVKKHMERTSGKPFTYVPSGIASARYKSRPKHERSGLLYIGRITAHKNIPLLMAAHERLYLSGDRWQLSIAGGGTDLEQIHQLREQSPVGRYVNVLGFVSEEQKIRLLSEAELLVIPSRREGFPRVVAEAMASGLPVVTVNFEGNGTKDVVEHYGVGVVTARDPSSLAEGIRSARTQWTRFSQAGLDARKSLDWKVVVDDLLELATDDSKGIVHEYATP